MRNTWQVILCTLSPFMRVMWEESNRTDLRKSFYAHANCMVYNFSVCFVDNSAFSVNQNGNNFKEAYQNVCYYKIESMKITFQL